MHSTVFHVTNFIIRQYMWSTGVTSFRCSLMRHLLSCLIQKGLYQTFRSSNGEKVLGSCELFVVIFSALAPLGGPHELLYKFWSRDLH